MSESLLRNSLSTTQCTVLVIKKGRAYGCKNFFITAQSTEFRHEKGTGPMGVCTVLKMCGIITKYILLNVNYHKIQL